MSGKICLKDSKETVYIFQSTGEVIINGKLQGIGRLVTPISQLSLTNIALFTIGEKKLKTDSLKGCLLE